MIKKVNLTWKAVSGKTITEECYLIPEDTVLKDAQGNQYEGALEPMAQRGFVIFEDENGIFGLRPEQVVNIDVLEEFNND